MIGLIGKIGMSGMSGVIGKSGLMEFYGYLGRWVYRKVGVVFYDGENDCEFVMGKFEKFKKFWLKLKFILIDFEGIMSDIIM